MQKTCAQCSASFEITENDLAFYKKISPVIAGKIHDIPPPTLCPDCRRQRRLAFRNERCLYHRKCDLTGKQMISVFSPKKTNQVYLQAEWWSDKWKSLSYGRTFNFSENFFDQFSQLLLEVPQMNVIGEANENSDYCNLTANCRNCYLVFESSNNEDCLYGYWLQKCENCCDTSFSHESRWCYEVDNCYNCHALRWSRNCTDCSDGLLLRDCIGCKNCAFCMNLRQKEYCIFNRQFTKSEYERQLEEMQFGSAQALSDLFAKFEQFRLTMPHRATQFVQAENCTGDYIQQSRNCIECYHAHQAEDCKYGEHVWRDSKNNMDVSTVGRGADCIYEAINTGIGASRSSFTNQCWSGCSDLLYCSNCFSSTNCFGCVGLRNNRFCILNKQYSKEEYEALVPKIIEHMRSTKEWGEFFPVQLSLFGYNETPALEQFPISRADALKQGWKWHDEEVPKDQYLGPRASIGETIAEVPNDITKQILTCEVTGKPFKIIPQELKFYKTMGIPVPRKSPEQRHKERFALRTPRRLWSRTCGKCEKAIETTYSPDRPEIVYCEKCYLGTVY